MASGLEVIGALNAIMAIAGGFGDLSGKFRRCMKALSHARDDIQKVQDETTIFTATLRWFHDTMQTMFKRDKPSLCDPEKAQLLKEICRKSESILKKTKRLLLKVDPLRTDKNHSFIFRTLLKFRWLMDKNDVDSLLLALNLAKLDLILFTALQNMDNIIKEIARL
jgi:hypothetical protein